MTSAQPWTDAQINVYTLTHIALPGLVLLAAILLADRLVFTPKIRSAAEARAQREVMKAAYKRAARRALFRRNVSRGPALQSLRRRR